jgi:putative endonuclease
MPSPTQQRGTTAEDSACEKLERAGCEILARNLRCRCGEIDIVARQGNTLIVAEVRQRSSTRFGGAAASIGFIKRRRILCATQYFLCRQPAWGRYAIRFDALVLEADGELQWLRHVFEA